MHLAARLNEVAASQLVAPNAGILARSGVGGHIMHSIDVCSAEARLIPKAISAKTCMHTWNPCIQVVVQQAVGAVQPDQNLWSSHLGCLAT